MSMWEDVRVEECSADLLVGQLLATGRALLEAIGALEGDVPIVTEDWRGGYRRDFDDRLPALVGALSTAVATLEGAALTVRRRLDEGVAEQRRRNRARQDFHAQWVQGP